MTWKVRDRPTAHPRGEVSYDAVRPNSGMVGGEGVIQQYHKGKGFHTTRNRGTVSSHVGRGRGQGGEVKAGVECSAPSVKKAKGEARGIGWE